LTEAGVLEEDRLFATVDSTSRLLEFSDARRIVLSDTVGFIRKIPHQLVASFHATLEEAVHADLLLHVVDLGEPNAEEQIRVVEEVLIEIGARPEEEILVLNKVDRATEANLGSRVRGGHNNMVVTSARTGEGIDRLQERICRFVEEHEVLGEVRFPLGDEAVRASLHRTGEVLEERFGSRWTRVRVRMRPLEFERLQKRGVEVSFDGDMDEEMDPS
jgi:GTP-binding protein HflX